MTSIKRKELFYNNLLLLGLDCLLLEKKHGVSFQKDMFVRPNKKGYEVVTHFLFSKLSAVTGKDYNLPWPLLDKQYERAFQKTCYSHLMNFSQEKVVRFPQTFPSLLSTFGGDRFYEVYLAFSCYVLAKTIQKNNNLTLKSRPTISQENVSGAARILKLSTLLHMKNFRNTQQVTWQNLHACSLLVKNLEKELKEVELQLRANDDMLEKCDKEFSTLYSTDLEKKSSIDEMIEKCMHYLKPFIKERKSLQQFFASEKTYWESLSSEVGTHAHNRCLNGQDYNVTVSGNLSDEYLKTVHSVGHLSSEENDKLSVKKFVALAGVYLTCICNLLKKVDFEELHKTLQLEDVSCIESDLKYVNKLSARLENESIPNLEENITKLKSLEGFDDCESLELSFVPICPPLPVQSFDLESVIKRTSLLIRCFEDLFQLPASECKAEILDDRSEKDLAADFRFIHSGKSLMRQAYTGDSSARSDNFPQRMPAENSNAAVFDESNATRGGPSQEKYVNFMSGILSPRLSISIEDDLDLSPAPRFRMRESWLHVESLDSVTLPDVIID